jgi:hypothetical protein
MITRFLGLLLVCFYSINIATAQCTSAMSTSVFGGIRSEIIRATTPLNKLNIAQDRTRTLCFYSYQVKEIASLLDNDNDKLSFCKNAYCRTIDQENFYEVYDVIMYPSNMFRLNDYIRDMNSSIPPPSTTTTIPYTTAINYPDARFYTGSKGCALPISNIEFQNMLNTVRVQTVDIARYNTAKALLNTKCVSVEQLMRICEVIGNEAYRLDILKTYIANTYDRGNFSYGAQLLSIESYRNDYTNFCISISTPTPPPVVIPVPIDSFSGCRVNNTDFTNMKTSIEKLSFNNTQVAQIKTLMNTRCFTVAQIKILIKILGFEASKLDIAKYGYDKCIDKNNYFSVNDEFTYSSSISELNEYINNR